MTFSLSLSLSLSLLSDRQRWRREQNCHDGNFEGGRQREAIKWKMEKTTDISRRDSASGTAALPFEILSKLLSPYAAVHRQTCASKRTDAGGDVYNARNDLLSFLFLMYAVRQAGYFVSSAAAVICWENFWHILCIFGLRGWDAINL